MPIIKIATIGKDIDIQLEADYTGKDVKEVYDQLLKDLNKITKGKEKS